MFLTVIQLILALFGFTAWLSTTAVLVRLIDLFLRPLSFSASLVLFVVIAVFLAYVGLAVYRYASRLANSTLIVMIKNIFESLSSRCQKFTSFCLWLALFMCLISLVFETKPKNLFSNIDWFFIITLWLPFEILLSSTNTPTILCIFVWFLVLYNCQKERAGFWKYIAIILLSIGFTIGTDIAVRFIAASPSKVSDYIDQKRFENRLHELPSNSEFKIKNLTDFSWNRVCFFIPVSRHSIFSDNYADWANAKTWQVVFYGQRKVNDFCHEKPITIIPIKTFIFHRHKIDLEHVPTTNINNQLFYCSGIDGALSIQKSHSQVVLSKTGQWD